MKIYKFAMLGLGTLLISGPAFGRDFINRPKAAGEETNQG